MQDMADLEDMEQSRAEFLSLVGQELREPLTFIKGSAVTLRESLDSLGKAEILQFLRIIESQSDRMRDLMGELQDMARIKNSAFSVAPKPTEVTALVNEARSAFLAVGQGRSIVLDLDPDPDLPWVMADRGRIVQVLSNLLSNAARRSPETSTIRLTGAREGGVVALSVTDPGAGVEPERLDLLFRGFAPFDKDAPDQEATGAGLGLAVCKGIVEAHGGRIRADSDGAGTESRLTFTLPVADVTERAATGTSLPSGSSPQATREQGCILVVDDDPMTLRSVREILNGAGYTPLATGDPEEALRLYESERPQLVLLDLLLPGSDGIDLMEDMFGIGEAPVIFLSGYGRQEVIAKALDSGAMDYIVKPFSSTELKARVRAALRRRLTSTQDDALVPFVLEDLTLDYARRTVSVAGKAVSLTPTEYALLSELSINAGLVLTFDHLLERVWGLGYSADRRNLRTYVKRLRRKLGENADSPKYIFPAPRIGYRMVKPDVS
ncbi:MAG: response regulator [Chloroflexi bacterium]|nr:response regulator [Chloroflexota bacterium]